VETLARLEKDVVACTLCPRLVAWREEAARRKPPRFREWSYWARPLPGFGDGRARLLVVGLAPAAHGGNRTGRIFTGDESGNWLFRALHDAGFANQASSVRRGDGLELADARVTAAVRCAPPANRPSPREEATCRPFLAREIAILRPRVIVCLGGFAWSSVLRALGERGVAIPRPRPRFAHGTEVSLDGGALTLIGSYHPSQQNTFTRRLTRPMLDRVFALARARLGATPGRPRSARGR
jgi:uracil-DNA glycosylase family 4